MLYALERVESSVGPAARKLGKAGGKWAYVICNTPGTQCCMGPEECCGKRTAFGAR